MRRLLCFYIVIVMGAAGGLRCGAAENGKGDEFDTLSKTVMEAPVIPVIEGAVLEKAKRIREKGRSMGARPNVFAKIGDSITAYPQFLYDIGNGKENLAGYSDLAATVEKFRAEAFGGFNSFNRVSLAAGPGWLTGSVLRAGWAEGCAEGGSALACELEKLSPAYAVIMFGTNDIGDRDLARFEANMDEIADVCESMGVVPILSTIPDRLDTREDGALVAEYNQAIVDLSEKRSLPLINYWRALTGLPNKGLGADGIHPSASPLGPADFSDKSLAYGYNVRNLTFLQTLDALEGKLR